MSNKYYITNYSCHEPYFNEFKRYFPSIKEVSPHLWLLTVLPLPIPLPPEINVVWVHVWDDSPFSGSPFQEYSPFCNPKKNFFVHYHDGWWLPDDEFLKSKFGRLYPDEIDRKRHVFTINRNTDEGKHRLAELVSAVEYARMC